MGWVGYVVRVEDRRSVYKHLRGNLKGKRQLGRHKRRLEYNIKMDIQKLVWRFLNWIGLTQEW